MSGPSFRLQAVSVGSEKAFGVMADFCGVIRSNLCLNLISVYSEIKAVASRELLLTPENRRDISHVLFPLPSCISFRDSFA